MATAFYKVWVGTTGDYTLASNWQAISVRTAAYVWTASGSGTNEYYLSLSGPADPGFSATPGSVQINGTDATAGSVGSLAAGEWAYGDNDTLGYSTIYVRLSDGADPDSKTLDYVTFKQRPYATEHVRLPAGAGDISSNLDASSVSLGSFISEFGYEGEVGTATGPLVILTALFEWQGTGLSYIDLFTSNISPLIRNTASAEAGTRGLYLKGSNLATVSVLGGSVGLAWLAGQTTTATACRVSVGRGSLWVGSGTTLTTFQQLGGTNELRCAATTVTVNGGSLVTTGTGAITTLNITSGTVNANATGTITTVNLSGGTLDMSGSTAARTITTLNHNPRISGSDFIYDPAVITTTTRAEADGPCRQVRASL